jgi:hypothetical protein
VRRYRVGRGQFGEAAPCSEATAIYHRQDMADSRVEKWRRWIDDRIYPDVRTMHLHRDVFQRVGKILRENGTLPPSYYWLFLRETYAKTQAVAIRRQADPSSRVISLGSLVYEISENADSLTRESFLELWGDDDRHYGEREFDRLYAGGMGAHLDPAVPLAHLAELRQSAASVKRYVDEHLAHSDARQDPELPTLDDIEKAVGQIGDLFQRYAHLLTAKTYGLVTILRPEWEAIFHVPWIRPGSEQPDGLASDPRGA